MNAFLIKKSRRPFARCHAATCLVLTGVMSMANATSAVTDWSTASFLVSLESGVAPITNIQINTSYRLNQGSASAMYTAPAGTNVLTIQYLTNQPPRTAFMIGRTQNLPGDTPGTDHLVLFINQAAAAAAEGKSWNDLYPGVSESELLDLVTPTTMNELVKFSNFVSNQSTLGLFGEAGAVASPWFNIGESFKVVAFSNGRIIGSGRSALDVLMVPEPETVACVFSGLMALAITRVVRKPS